MEDGDISVELDENGQVFMVRGSPEDVRDYVQGKRKSTPPVREKNAKLKKCSVCGEEKEGVKYGKCPGCKATEAVE